MYKIFLSSVLLFGLIAMPIVDVYSQEETSSQPSLRSTPTYPSPGESFYVFFSGIENFVGDGNRINWIVDGVARSDFLNNRRIDLESKNIGEPTVISASVVSSSNSVIFREEIIVMPLLFNLLWEAETTTPIGYKGRPLVTPDAVINVIAFLEYINEKGQRYTARDFLIDWDRGVLASANEIISNEVLKIDGESLFKFPLKISAEATLKEENIFIKEEVSIPVVDPLVKVYQRHPIYGLLADNSLSGDLVLLTDGINLFAQPIYFPLKYHKNNNLLYSWGVNGEIVQKGPLIKEVKLDRTEEDAGIEVFIRNFGEFDSLLTAQKNINFISK